MWTFDALCNNYTLFFNVRIYFITLSRLEFAKFHEFFKNKAGAEILKRIDIILCVETSVNTIQFYVFLFNRIRLFLSLNGEISQQNEKNQH